MASATPRQVTRVRIADIRVPAERRARVDDVVVERLMQSIERRGLLSPLRVRIDGILVCGLHRLVSCERLGRDDVEVVYHDGDEIDAELDEIEENLCRRDLTVLERARGERRQEELYLLRHPDTRRGVAGALARHGQQAKTPSFAASEAKPGDGVRVRQQRIQFAKALSEEIVQLIAEHPLGDNHSQLVELARTPSDLRQGVARLIVVGKAKNVAGALDALTKVKPAPTPKVKPATAGELVLVPVEGALRGEFVVAGRRVQIQTPIGGGTSIWRDIGVALPTAAPCTSDDRPLTILTSFNVAADVVADLPGDLARDVTVGPITVEDWGACSRCGGTKFWRSFVPTYRCATCHPIDTLHVETSDIGVTAEQLSRRGLRTYFQHRKDGHHTLAERYSWERRLGSIRHEWRRRFQIADTVNVRSPRLTQTLTVSPAPDARKRRLLQMTVQWWAARDRLVAEAVDSVLVEVVDGGSAIIRTDRLRPRVQALRELITTAVMETFWYTHGLTARRGRYFRRDGSEVRLVHRVREAPNGHE